MIHTMMYFFTLQYTIIIRNFTAVYIYIYLCIYIYIIIIIYYHIYLSNVRIYILHWMMFMQLFAAALDGFVVLKFVGW